MNTKELAKRVKFCIEKGINVLLVGSPGIGKSQWLDAICKDINTNSYSYIPATGNPTHILGLPFASKDGDKAEFLPYDLIHAIMNCEKEKPFVVHIEDFIQAAPAMQAALMSLIQLRKVNNKPIPDNVRFVIDTNDAKHRAGGAIILAPILTRVSIFHFDLQSEDWIRWGIESKRICLEVLLFIRSNPDALNQFPSSQNIEAYPCPRSYEAASKYIQGGFNDTETLSSVIGNEQGANLSAFIADIQRFGTLIPQINKDYKTATLFNSLSDIYGAGVIIANNIKKDNIQTFINYLNRYEDKEIAKFIIELAASIHPDCKETKAYIDFAIANQ